MLADFWQKLCAVSAIEWFGMVTGFLGVWWSIQEKTAAWVAYLLCYAAYVWISIDFGLHAFIALNAIFIVISIYGWIQWQRSQGEEQAVANHPKRTPTSELALWGAGLVIGTLAIAYLLSRRGEAQFLYWDASACAIALLAQWFLSRKQIETWLLWILSDAIYLGIFIYNQAWPSVILFAAFILLAAKGWCDWNQQIKSSNS